VPPRSGFALFPAFPIPRNAAQLRFLRIFSVLWVVRLSVVVAGLLLLRAAGVL
jgi:hypothetical protein